MSRITYSGTHLTGCADLPAEQSQAGFEALAFIAQECTLKSVPGIMREWSKVADDLVCARTNTQIKGAATWQPITFPLNRVVSDPFQQLLALMEDNDDVGSFRMSLPGAGGTIYWTAQCSKMSLADGGGKETIHQTSIELLIQTKPLFVPAP